MMLDKKVIDWIALQRRNGAPTKDIQEHLVKSGFNEKDVLETLAAMENAQKNIEGMVHPEHHARYILIAIVVLMFLVAIGGAGYYYSYLAEDPVFREEVETLQQESDHEELEDINEINEQYQEETT